MIDKNITYAIVGASNNPEKYGYKVLKDLHEAGYKVIPINPKGGEILGLKVYPYISDVSEKVDLVVFIVPPQVTEKVLNEVKELGIKQVWMQPGSESDASIQFCENNGIDCRYNACVMIERKR